MENKIEKFLSKHGGVMSVSELADVLAVDEGAVRRWARLNDVRRVGSTFVFARESALECAEGVRSEQRIRERHGIEPVSSDDMTLEWMISGLVRAAELKEQEECGMIWDDESRTALEEARRRGWGNGQIGSLSEPEPSRSASARHEGAAEHPRPS